MSAEQVFDTMLQQAESEVQKQLVSNKRTSKLEEHFFIESTVDESAAATLAVTTHEVVGMQKYDHLRWYLLPSDVQNVSANPPVLSRTVHGPIHPERFNMLTSSSSSNGGGVLIEMTAYAETRDRKLAKHCGNVDMENKVPRFIRLILEHAEDKNSLLESLKSHNLRLRGTDGNASNSTQLTITPPQQESNQKVKSQLLSSAFATATTANSVDADNSTAMCAMDSCSTGTCILRAPNGYENNVVVEDGKILSGPGNYFPAIPGQITGKFSTPPKKFMKAVGQAIKEWGMIQDGDRLLLGLSGGKDSLALLHTLRALQIRAPVKFEFACATVDPQTTSFDPSPLIPYVQSLGITYHYLSQPIIELAKSKLQGDSLCAFCSRFKRGLLYSCCRTYGYNKLVLAQHLDDLCESFMMSLLHNGQTRTMKAKYLNDAGDISIIRPFIYLREAQTRDFSMSANLNIINENCPACFEQPKERARMKKLLQQEEAMVPNLFYNLKRALVPLMHDDTYYVLKEVSDKIAAAGNERYDYSTCSRKKGREESKSAGCDAEEGLEKKQVRLLSSDDGTNEPAMKKLREDDTNS
jgi:tRNA(Ile)-lysidine synthase TilS/MesJ